MSEKHISHPGGAGDESVWLEIVRQHVASLSFGVVEITVHDSRVTQIDKTERVRLDKPQPEIKRLKIS